MITIMYDYFEKCIRLQIITSTDYAYPRSVPCGPVPYLFKLCPLVQKWPCPRGNMFYIGLYRETLKKSSRLKPQGLEL